MFQKSTCLIVAAFTSLLILGLTASTHGLTRGNDSYAVKTGYFCIEYVSQSVSGDFDGESIYYVSGNSYMQTALVPKVETGGGFRIVLGARFPKVAWEIFYSKSSHDAYWLEFPVDVSTKSFGTNVLIYLSTRTALQPFFLVGGYYHSLNVTDASNKFTLEWDPEEGAYVWRLSLEGDASYSGLGAGVGPGIQCYISSGISIRGEVLYNFAFCSTVKMVPDQSGTRLEEKISANGYSISVGIVVGF